MMTPLPTCDLVRLVEIMNDMHDSATTSDWQQLARLDEERRTILQVTSSTALNTKVDLASDTRNTEHQTHKRVDNKSAPLTDVKREFLVAEIRSLDKLILDVVQTRRQSLLDKNRGLSAQQKAKELYAKANSIT